MVSFDGTQDPQEHIESYRAHMAVNTTCKAFLCKFFPTTLSGLALSWYTSLPCGSVESFAQLEKIFLDQFIVFKRQKKSCIHLMSVIQQEGELVSSYIKRFHDEVLTITNISDSATVSTLINGLRTHKLKWHLIENGVSSYVEAMQIAQRFVQASEICTPIDSQAKKKKNDKLQSQSQPHAKPYQKEYTGYSQMGSGRQEPPGFDHN
ncbi:uncharacterized protein LOC130801008 [Amaranthus tricolor]|uniref:uncharacterized protein LOC130801008 n=1 Tax=Amaranthus tricolor TaxID=29722 RepID=UPI00258C8A9C|nr:uncharacterized protein LOC130801008 [Amaranthus tricolor]